MSENLKRWARTPTGMEPLGKCTITMGAEYVLFGDALTVIEKLQKDIKVLEDVINEIKTERVKLSGSSTFESQAANEAIYVAEQRGLLRDQT